MKKYLAELLGTFVLCSVVALSPGGMFPVPTGVLAALTVAVFVYTIGHISGTHLNPAVTIGAWSIHKIRTKDVPGYVVAQMAGAGLAFALAHATLGIPPLAEYSSSLAIGFAELFGTFLLTFGIASVMYGKTKEEISGIAIGGSLLIGVASAALIGSSGALNPAVAFSVGSLNLMYVLGPICGGILGMQVYKYLCTQKN